MNEWSLQNDLHQIETGIWQLLQEATQSHKAPFHHATVATVFEQVPEVRTVVLRRVLQPERSLFFHTDIRSPKARHLQQQPALTWLFYSKEIRTQLRCYAQAVVHTNGSIADYGWQHSRLSSQLCYTPLHAPGTPLTQPNLVQLNRKDVDEAELRFARSHFAVVETVVHAIDWVFLHHDGNRRAYFDYRNNCFQWIQV